MTPETAIFEFLSALVAETGAPDPLAEIDLHDTEYQQFQRGVDRGVRISEATGFTGPKPDGAVGEWDVQFFLTCYARVTGKDKTERLAAREAAAELGHAVLGRIYADPSLGGRVCSAQPGRFIRDFDTLDNADYYATFEIPLVVNPTGRRLPAPFSVE
jgi:hypothetical protein